jgi:predicted nucleic acid-binding protein
VDLCVKSFCFFFFLSLKSKLHFENRPGVARKILEDIAQLPIDIVPADLDLTRAAAELRANHKLPYADAFAASLASHRRASLATSDKDFASVEKKTRHPLDERLAAEPYACL